jgi:hypothetical protein
MNDIIHKFDKSNLNQHELKIDVYYHIDFDQDIIHEFFDHHFQDILKEYNNDIHINKFIKVQTNNIKHPDDIIKRGTDMFHNMFDKLKLKNSNPLWFIYIGKGSLKTNTSIIEDVYIGLINKDPSIKRCFYSIHKENDKNNMIKSVNIILKKMFLNKQKMICY